MKMKLKPKQIIITVACIAVFILLAIANQHVGGTIRAVPIADLPLTYEYAGTNFYYNQLDAVEQRVYDQLTEKLDAYEGGEVLLEEEISVNNLSRIADAIRFNDGNNYFYMLFTYPLTADNKLVDWRVDYDTEEAEKKQISKILLELYIGEEDTRLDGFQISEDMIVTNYEEQKHLFDTIPDELISKYKAIGEETDQILDEIIAGMPEGLNQEEAVLYFNRWFIMNMKYTYSFYVGTPYGEVLGEKEQFCSSMAGLTQDSAICSGFASILAELCNRVGIESYACLGTVTFRGCEAGYHAWTAVVIDGTTYYTDPTLGEDKWYASPLATRDQLDYVDFNKYELSTYEFDY